MSTRVCAVVLAVAAVGFGAAACGNGQDQNAESKPMASAQPAPAERPQNNDALIATRVRGQFFTASDVKGQNIDVSADHGVVTLDGTVPTEQARQKALDVARDVEGVKDVKDNLSVGAPQTARAGQGANAADHSPAWITTKIEAQLYAHPGVKPWNIDVATSNNDVVTLSGTVASSEDHDKALQIARQTDGVADVDDQLRVASDTAATSGTEPGTAGAQGTAGTSGTAAARSSSPPAAAGNALSDAWITAKIQSKYFVDPDVKGRNIDVDTSAGVVTLRGDVGSYSERRQAASMARSTDGVKEVRDELRVVRNAPNAASGSSQRSTARKVDDQWIQTKVQSKFFIDSDVRSQQIDVQSRNGVVTLTGTADSSNAKQTAEQLARDTSGVKRVVDKVKVSPEAGGGQQGATQPAPGQGR